VGGGAEEAGRDLRLMSLVNGNLMSGETLVLLSRPRAHDQQTCCAKPRWDRRYYARDDILRQQVVSGDRSRGAEDDDDADFVAGDK